MALRMGNSDQESGTGGGIVSGVTNSRSRNSCIVSLSRSVTSGTSDSAGGPGLRRSSESFKSVACLSVTLSPRFLDLRLEVRGTVRSTRGNVGDLTRTSPDSCSGADGVFCGFRRFLPFMQWLRISCRSPACGLPSASARTKAKATPAFLSISSEASMDGHRLERVQCLLF